MRFDAGYPGEPDGGAGGAGHALWPGCATKRLALPAMRRGLGCVEQRGARICESSYRAGSWSRSRRVVQVSSSGRANSAMPSGEMSARTFAVPQARQGGGPPGGADERRRPGPVVNVAPQEPLPCEEIGKREKGVDAFACNQVRLLAGFAYDHACPARRAGARDSPAGA